MAYLLYILRKGGKMGTRKKNEDGLLVEASSQKPYSKGFDDRINERCDSTPPEGVDYWWWKIHYQHGQEDAQKILDE
ncbi:MAG: hypothetical protein PHW15_00070 [Patescibacteria group bacterium]|jgi:hypothetical protein|nr:hypothetical protein [Patescibacteria group bacterium]MDD5172678.1 hypothetical protein [Patescibacteria group bacterium]